MKKVLAILVCVITIIGWYFSAAGFGGASGILERLNLGLDMIGGVSVVLEAQTDATGSELKTIMDQVKAVMENRINEMGLSEPVIAIENENRIRIELPGAQNAQEAIKSIGKTAVLKFMTADGNTVLTGSNIRNASSDLYQGTDSRLLGTYVVTLEFDSEGTGLFTAATQKIVNKEIVSTTEYDAAQIIIFLDDDPISDPYVNSVINSSSCFITGSYNADSAGTLAALIRGGSLPVSLAEVQTEIVGPTLGEDAAVKCAIAGFIGVMLIFAIMIGGYMIMGVVADIALALYVLIVAWIYVLLHAVLTLPGIAGLILSIGMAVDSNVIIFTRIKEEIALGKSVRVAVKSGYKRALTTIIDSQVTTIIAALILYMFGTGSVKGFALTLMIGIIVSLFTAVTISQLMLNVIAESKKLGTAKMFGVKKTVVLGTEDPNADKKEYDILSKRRILDGAAIAVIVVGLGIGLIRGFNLGIDFTGGTMLQLNNGKQVELAQVNSVLSKYGISADIQFAGEGKEKLIIKTTTVIDNDMRDELCADMRKTLGVETAESAYIEQAGLIGPSVGTQLKSNAIKSCLLAVAAMLVYVAIRFEWRYGIAAILALCHDMLMLFAFYGLFHVQMNSPFIAGLLIVLGYSINDTIVIFDRIRENVNISRKTKLDTLVNRSINQCIGRSIMTSVTTMVAILPLIIICGDSIRQFALPLIAGVLFGTFSSLGIASGLYLDIVKLTKHNRYKGA